VQGQWLLHAGLRVNGGHVVNTLFSFDFHTLSWTEPDMAGASLDYRFWHSACCHEDALVVMGGERNHTPLYYASVHVLIPSDIVCLLAEVHSFVSGGPICCKVKTTFVTPDSVQNLRMLAQAQPRRTQ